jgi:hypothetical protein
MTTDAARDYVAKVDPSAAPNVLGLDKAIRSAHPQFDVAIKYGILMYAIDGDWRTWVCAVDASKKRVSLRFLYGVILGDPLGVLRKGSSVLMTWDFSFDEKVDVKAVKAYVNEAVAKKSAYAADSDAIQAAAKKIKPTRAGSTGP